MCKKRVALVWSLPLVLVVGLVSNMAVAAGPEVDANLVETIRLFFTLDPEFRPGDLITRTQVEELQTYLRKTRREGPATEISLLARSLPESTPLVRFFYQDDGSELLRQAAKQLGGYEPIYKLCHMPQERLLVRKAILKSDLSALLAVVADTTNDSPHLSEKGGPSSLSLPTNDLDHGKSTTRLHRIFTVEELIDALKPPVIPPQCSQISSTSNTGPAQ